jgi:1,2-phenylacetyl-CoA epoxidase catalytic subunit
MARTRSLVAGGQAASVVQKAIDDLVAFTVAFFGRSVSANNEAFRRWGVKHRTNDEARAEWAARSRRFVEGDLGLRFPSVDERWNG